MVDSLATIQILAQEHGTVPACRLLQKKTEEVSDDELDKRMYNLLSVMRESVEVGMDKNLRSMSGLTGGQAFLYQNAINQGKTAGDSLLSTAGARALAIAECNASMGRIVAAPTAGACGILPAALFAMQDKHHLTDEELLPGLYIAATVGLVIAKRASISGAQGGCQAECGTASAMAASACTLLCGGTVKQALDACGFALMNVMGLVCDPVGGLVEIPCVYRNVMGVSNALTSADLALSGIACPLVPDEIIDAMREVGDLMPACLRETGEGGCAACPSAKWKTEK